MSTTHRHQHTDAADSPETLASDDDAQLERDRRRELLAGGNASRAPHSLHATELHPIEGASSGTSWDDPDEL
jgi:hypothetical protein